MSPKKDSLNIDDNLSKCISQKRLLPTINI